MKTDFREATDFYQVIFQNPQHFSENSIIIYVCLLLLPAMALTGQALFVFLAMPFESYLINRNLKDLAKIQNMVENPDLSIHPEPLQHVKRHHYPPNP